MAREEVQNLNELEWTYMLFLQRAAVSANQISSTAMVIPSLEDLSSFCQTIAGCIL